MAIQSDETLVTKGDLKTLYTDKILPYLGGNMMMQTGVSDYYSEDEKVVGIWINGKPVYQRTVITNTGTGNVQYSIASWNVDEVMGLNGVIEQEINGIKYYPTIFFNGSTEYSCNIHVSPHDSRKAIIINTGFGYYNYRIFITIQYTKTTDTASTALTTPGCYDISRPDLWPTGKEIFFGNGLYGYRKTGTITAAIDARVWTDIVTLPAGVLPSIIQSGGWIKWGDEGQHDYKYPVNTAMTDLTGWGSTLGAWSVVRTANSQIALWNTCGLTRTDAPYDVWCTYTKN